MFGYKLIKTEEYEKLKSNLADANGIIETQTAHIAELINRIEGLEKVIADMKEKTGVESVVDYPLNASSFLNEIMSSTQLSSSNFVPTEFKELKDYYDVVNRIKRMSNVQCKMEDITIK